MKIFYQPDTTFLSAIAAKQALPRFSELRILLFCHSGLDPESSILSET
jgi:hypothetical protein